MTFGGAKNADTTNGIRTIASHENLAILITSEAITSCAPDQVAATGEGGMEEEKRRGGSTIKREQISFLFSPHDTGSDI